MFNTPIPDIAIGLCLLFLSYSLLATSIKEGIATLFALRARMLRRGIINGMLTATPNYTRFWDYVESFGRGISNLWPFKQQKDTLGARFYQHPMLKNYGSSGFYKYPSYLPSENFSLILVDVMKQDYFEKFPNMNGQQIQDIDSIRNLLDEYRKYHNDLTPYANPVNEPQKVITAKNCLIDKETASILFLHLRMSKDMDTYKGRLEDWFEDSMNRVSGWYKRQVQFILFFIGITMAFIFNVDTINIASRLSKSNTLRGQVISSAVAYSKTHQNVRDNGQKKIFEDSVFDSHVNSRFNVADSLINHDIHDVNSLILIGYGDYGATDSVFVKELKDKIWLVGYGYWLRQTKDEYAAAGKYVKSTLIKARDPAANGGRQYDSLVNNYFFQKEMREHPLHTRKAYAWYCLWTKRTGLAGFLILAFAVCLGAPFWFDLLSMFVNIRATGKKEDGDGTGTPAK